MVNRADIKYKVDEKRLDLQKELTSMLTEKKDYVMKSVAEGYLNYKKSYVKNLLFSRDAQNLSEFIILKLLLLEMVSLQLKQWRMYRSSLCTFSLTRLHLMRLKGM